VYDSLGAQWNAAGLDTVEGPVVLADPPIVCPVEGLEPHEALVNPDEVAGNIVLVERGGCNFLEKVKILHELNAIGVIVMDTEDEDLLLMGGSSDAKMVPSVMIKKNVGNALKNHLKGANKQEVWVKMLSGLEAMQKKGGVGALGGDNSKKVQLPDFLGYNSMIEDQVKRRFTIFPFGPVGVGDVWHRKVQMQLEGQKVPTWVDESYELMSMPEAPPCVRSRWSANDGCDAATVRDGRVKIMLNTSAVQKHQKNTGPPSPETTGMMNSMNADGRNDIFVKESGIITVDASSGMLFEGSAEQVMTGKAHVVFVNGKMEDGAYLKTQMQASTEWTGHIKPLRRALH